MKILTDKGAVIDAVRFDQAEVYARMGCIGMDLETGVSFLTPDAPYIITSDGRPRVTDGDWIVTYPDGRAAVLSPTAFEAAFPGVEIGATR